MCCRVVVFGITGSIGTGAHKIISTFPENFKLVGCSAGKNIDLLNEILVSHSEIEAVAVKDSEDINKVGFDQAKVFSGEEGLMKLLDLKPDRIINAIAGNSGWKITLEAVKRGITVCLANKESVVIAGYYLGKEITTDRSKIIPIDSEHAALMQIMEKSRMDDISKVYLTASGGALRNMNADEMLEADARAALKHPVWNMGAKVTVDSATMLNKGLELIEAYWLFGIEPEKLGVLVHPEVDMHASIVFKDGSSISQFAPSSMLIPIAAALSYPEILPVAERIPELAFSYSGKRMGFEFPDLEKYLLLKIAIELLQKRDFSGMVAYAVSDEIAVNKFLADEIKIKGIHEIVSKTVKEFSGLKPPADENEIEALIARIERFSFEISSVTLK
jgi:1-deoxy-D-xylulose-5-phosphate reductoisomerase